MTTALEDAVREFADGRAELADPVVALGRCGEVDAAFRAFVGPVLGVRCRSLFGVGPVVLSPGRAVWFAGVGWPVSALAHSASVVLVDGSWTVVDLTFAQFDERVVWPLVEPLCRYGRRFSGGVVWDVWEPATGRRVALR